MRKILTAISFTGIMYLLEAFALGESDVLSWSFGERYFLSCSVFMLLTSFVLKHLITGDDK
jgi:hypothetical protein